MIEYCKSDRGDKALYAFRHPNIQKWSMLVTYDARMDGLVSVAPFSGYGGAVANVSADFFKGRRRSDPGEHVPMVNIPATPEALMGIELVQRVVLDRFEPGAGRESRLDGGQRLKLVAMLDAMVKAEAMPEAGFFSEAAVQPGTPFTNYLVEYEQQANLHRQEQEEIALAEQMQVERAYHETRNAIMPDWGSW